MFRLSRGRGRLRLCVGAGLDALLRQGMHHELGFSSVAAYSYERLSIAGRPASEMRTVARRLAGLPRTRRALTRGRIDWSMAEVLGRHATAETEAELLGLARTRTVRAMGRLLRARAKRARGQQAGAEQVGAEENDAMAAGGAVQISGTGPGGHVVAGAGAGEGTPAGGAGAVQISGTGGRVAADAGAGTPAGAAGAVQISGTGGRVAADAGAGTPAGAAGAVQISGTGTGGHVTDADDAVGEAHALRSDGGAPEGDPEDDAEDDEAERGRTLTLTVPIEEAWALEGTRMLAEHLAGHGVHDGGGWLEVVLAEGQTSLTCVAPPGADVLCEDMEFERELLREEREASAERRARAEARAARWVVAQREDEAGEAPEEEELPADPVRLDHYLRDRAMEHASRDLWLGGLLGRFFAADGWRRLGYATDTQYCRERLGMSRASAYKMMRLARRTRKFARIAEALGNGDIGTEAAGLLVRVARQETEQAWVERAKGRTYKHLQEEVELVELALRLGGDRKVDPSPPSPDEVEAYQELVRDVLTGKLLRRTLERGEVGEAEAVQEAGGAASPDERGGAAGGQANGRHTGAVQMEAVQISGGAAWPDERGGAAGGQADGRHTGAVQMEAVQISGGADTARLGKVTLRIRTDAETALHFRQLEQAYLDAGGEPGTFLRFLTHTFAQTWVAHLGTSDRWEAIYARELYRCSSPVCFRKDCTLHHIRFRSQGGTDEPENLAAPCAFCHLEGIHQGRIGLRGPASRMRWRLGRTPVLEVDGRDKRRVA